MEKAGLKTFVYSFVFSLFTLFSVNGVYLRSLKSRTPETKIPSKNITLFLKDMSSTSAGAQGAPVKKIALSILPEPTPKQNLSEQIPLTADDQFEPEPERLLAAASYIPLQNNLPQNDTAAREDINSETEKVISNFEQMIKSRPQIEENVLQNHDVPDIQSEPDISTPEPAPVYVPETSTQIAMAAPNEPKVLLAPSADESSTAEPVAEVPVQAPNKAQPLIPLEKDRGTVRLVQNDVKSSKDIKDNQVALNAHDIPIKSMLKAENQPKAKADSSDGWQTMAEKKAAADSPWTVAKGSKFPRNEMVLRDEAYKQDEEEIRRILSANNPDFKDDKGTIKLASETAKNLLIPIPEEIMKEKNITPQLVSSSKNQAIEEEVNARHEELNDETEEQITPMPSEDKKGGLLNSITSIFSGSKKETPQVGDRIEEQAEDKNSLLSAFSRKKSRPATKILPTEIRLSFQPNRAEISGQTLRWIRAFAQKTAEEAATGLEIRIDGTSAPLLQRRRLNLLQNILINEGADPSKIKTTFTAREPNSFILRTMRINNEEMNIPQNRNIRAKNNYMQW